MVPSVRVLGLRRTSGRFARLAFIALSVIFDSRLRNRQHSSAVQQGFK